MKKIIALLLAAVLILSMAACAKEPADTTGSTEPSKDVSKLDEIYWRDSYTASDEDVAAAQKEVVGFAGEGELTNGMLQIFYWMEVYNFISTNGNYIALYGIDLTKPLDEQPCVNTDGTWQHYFLKAALDSWHCYHALAQMAEETNTPMDEDLKKDLDALPDLMAKRAKEEGFTDLDAVIRADAGAGCTIQDYYDYTEMCYMAFSYFNRMKAKIDPTDAMIEQYFNKYQSELSVNKNSGNNHSVRHVLIKVSGGTKDENGKTTYSDTDWEKCRSAAQKLLDDWLAGEHTEETFSAMAKEHSEDTGSNTNGGLYEGLNESTNFVTEFKEWYLAEGRKAGDYGLIKTDYGYHIMYYSTIEPQWITVCRQGVISEQSAKIVADATEKYEAMVTFNKLLLGQVSLSESKNNTSE